MQKALIARWSKLKVEQKDFVRGNLTRFNQTMVKANAETMQARVGLALLKLHDL